MKDNPVRNQTLETLITKSREGFPINPLYILELPIFNPENGVPFLETKIFSYGKNCTSLSQKNECEPDILCLKFNIKTAYDIKKSVKILKKILSETDFQLMLRGCGDDELDKQLLPELANCANKTCIIASANENTYKDIIPFTRKKHFVVLKSPIDINLAKEINILSNDLGQPLDKILIDTDIGGLGCGFEYGYSIIEKIRQEGVGDKFLDLPIISFAAEESLKIKEAKSQKLSASWGEYSKRILMLELTAASAIRAAGANLIVVKNPQTLKIMKGLS